MKNKKGKIKKIIALAILVLVLITALVASTYAKYTSSSSKNDEPTEVAKWNIELKDGDTSYTKVHNYIQPFNLFATIKDADYTAEETHVKVADGTIIVPGASGCFTSSLKLKNSSEEDAEFLITYSIISNSKNVPLQFATSEDGTWYNSLSDLYNKNPDLNEFTPIKIGSEVHFSSTSKIYWRWQISDEDNQENSNTSSEDSNKESDINVTAQATLTVRQIK